MLKYLKLLNKYAILNIKYKRILKLVDNDFWSDLL
jgi:hypothetical protein